jgi:hypothetical protein
MLRLTRERRAFVADKVGDTANLAVGALVFGQAVGQRGFSAPIAVAGFVIWLVVMLSAYLVKGDQQ